MLAAYLSDKQSGRLPQTVIVAIIPLAVALMVYVWQKKARAPHREVKPDELVCFELQVSPWEFRFPVLPHQPLLFAYRTDVRSELKTILMPLKGNKGRLDSLKESLGALIREHKVLETLLHEPEKAFPEEAEETAKQAMETPGLHLRLTRADGRAWRSHYNKDEIPQNILAFWNACHDLGLRELASMPGGTMDAASGFKAALGESAREGSLPLPTKLGRVKVMKNGDIFLNGKKASLEDLDKELTRLKRIGGGVEYDRENGDK